MYTELRASFGVRRNEGFMRIVRKHKNGVYIAVTDYNA